VGARQAAEATAAQALQQYLPVNILHSLGNFGGFDCYCIAAPRGLRPDSYDPARSFMEELVSYLTVRSGWSHQSFVQMGHGQDRTATRLFADHAREWIPEMGLGVWTNRPAPRQWKTQDFEEMDPATGMPPLLHSVYRVTADANGRLNAMTTMVGTGCGLQCLSPAEGEVVLREWQELFLEFIEDRVFRIFPWYVPLLDRTALVEPLETLTTRAMQNVALYIRESPEDGGILIASAEPLAGVITHLGCEQIESGPTPKWSLGN
jgi:hypothetical protein